MRAIKLRSKEKDLLVLNRVREVYGCSKSSFRVLVDGGTERIFYYDDKEICRDDRTRLEEALVQLDKTKTGVDGIVQQVYCTPTPSLRVSFKQFLSKHSSIIFTLVAAVLIDHFLFDGGLRNKIKQTIERQLDLLDGK